MDYQVSNKAKIWTTVLMIVGVVFTGIGIIAAIDGGHLGQKFLGNLLSNSFFFFSIAISAMFFLALQYATEAGWYVYIKRVIEAVTGFLPLGMGLLIITFLSLTFTNGAHIYMWMDPEVMTETGSHYDELSAGKGAYLNQPFFWARTIAYLAIYYFMWKGFMKRSIEQDNNPANAVDIHFKNYRRGALFLVFFAVFSSTSSWDWLMSIDIHWFSTLFGWYVFAGSWTSAMVVIILLLLYLKKLGYLPKVNESHIHDIGKWVFATSFLWAYLWFSQYMLIWYANIPEETTYYLMRIEHYKLLYFGMFIINFAFPMLILMSRDAKRHAGTLVFVGLVILAGHWLDVWIMVMGGSMGPTASIGFMEIGMAVLFLGLFTRVILVRLTKAPLVSKNHPFLDESLHHEI
ncbi:quinol:cytochrome C oxidoreductase [Brumimicrobium salinarum]|uniref:Quinol:cytochrome C oxidoreductase n=1 Tax=Brumimicrobium salinarum TaxID=2058658 RepID=A0A2I0R634_9FLAO|nr:quinol:cytochrome C oxidoreductase [Brumimicrobium salinarum]PKR82025.1 quinol:cytochrome C oxidoreductase [Brumimicrobium salinarum]